jgi:hypothetical protein
MLSCNPCFLLSYHYLVIFQFNIIRALACDSVNETYRKAFKAIFLFLKGKKEVPLPW